MTALLVVVGAMLGAPARYLVDRAVQARHGSAFPWGTWVVNVAGSFLLGMLAVGAPAGLVAGLGVGFCGALTTYSTFGYETVRLLEDGAWRHAVANLLGSILAGLGAAAGGGTVAFALWGQA